MKNILLYGDSFFWGVDASSGGRHDLNNRIGTICQKNLGEKYNVVTEGLRGRTMFGVNGWFPERDGLVQFGPIFASHLPLDMVVIMLGTNDLNTKTNHTPEEIVSALDDYKEKMKFWCEFMKYKLPQLIIVAPPEIDTSNLTNFRDIFADTAEKLPYLKNALQEYANKNSDGFIDASKFVRSYNTDGIHLDAPESRKLADAISEIVR